MELEELRRQIDELDAALVPLLVKRLQTAESLAQVKRAGALPVKDAGREKAVLRQVRELAGESYAGDVADIYQAVMAASRARQERLQPQQTSFEDFVEEPRPEGEAAESVEPAEPLYGLIGGRLSQSVSPFLHEQLGGYAYRLMEMTPEQLDGFLKARAFAGVNVTIPYKQTVMSYCDELSDRAKRCGAVNMLTIREGKLYGDNTDYQGFLYMARRMGLDFAGKTVLILGNGGAGGTVSAAVAAKGGRPIVVSRSGAINYRNVVPRYAGAQIIVNTTPVGMYPDIEETPLDLQPFTRLSAVLDVVYNPLQTRLLADAAALGIPCCGGLPMLAAQAKYAADVFRGMPQDDDCIEPVLQALYRRMKNVVLVGMPGCGKSTVGRAIAEHLGRELLDTDELVERAEGMKPFVLIEQKGEAAFREAEKRVIARVAAETNCVIATGGGAVLDAGNRLLLRQNGFVVLLQRDLSELSTDDRPLSHDLSALHDARLPLYKACADVTVVNTTVEQAAGHILAALDGVRL